MKEEKKEEGKKKGWISNEYHLVMGSICIPTLAFLSSSLEKVQSPGGRRWDCCHTALTTGCPCPSTQRRMFTFAAYQLSLMKCGREDRSLVLGHSEESPPLVLTLLYQWSSFLRSKPQAFQFLCWDPNYYFHHQSLRLKCYPYYFSHVKNLCSQVRQCKQEAPGFCLVLNPSLYLLNLFQRYLISVRGNF